MSLLIKALQKAEQHKSEATGNAAAASLPAAKPELELAPHRGSVPSLHEEGGFDESVLPRAHSHTPHQAAAVFRAGLGNGAGTPRAIWLAGGGMFFLLLLGGGFYYYLSSLEQPALVMARPHVPPAVPMPENPGLTEREVPEPAVMERPAVTPAPPVMPPAESPQAVAKTGEMVAAVEVKRTVRPGDEGSPKVIRSRAPTASVSEGVMAGYQAYLAGDDAAAGRHYRQAAQVEPRNVDAWLGLGAVALRLGKDEEASACYMRVLELEPRNAAAQTGLISLTAQADPTLGESRLKSLLAQQPEAAFLHSALGNLYAEQGQWPSAQQAYFQAYRFESSNAEYAFNLAVSLDQMGKADLALTHYQRALELLPRQGGGVDRAQLEARIGQLRQALNK